MGYAETTLTPFLRGKIHVLQPKKGYRFNVDSVALAGFAWVRDGERVLDLGTGSGILLLLLGYFYHPASLTGIEIQDDLASMAAKNLAANGWAQRGRVLHADLRRPDAIPGRAFDLVVSNPPYHLAGRGQTSASPEKALAKQTFSAELGDVAASAARAMAQGGRFCMVLPVARLGDAVAATSSAGLFPRVKRLVQDRPDAVPHLCLLQASLLPGRGCVDLPPLTLKEPGGTYGAEMRYWLRHDEPEGPRFFCDCMLGTLARHLRLWGADAAYARKADDPWLLDECRRTGRVLLTRDRPLLALCGREGVVAVDPASDAPREQLAAVRNAYGLPQGRPPRCLSCNAPKLEIPRENALGKVPPYTFLTRRRFTACASCGKLTWEGSHLDRFRGNVIG